MGLFTGTNKCAYGCGRTIPRRDTYCNKHARANGTTRAGTTRTATPAPKVTVCGRRTRYATTCHRSVEAGQACDNPAH